MWKLIVLLCVQNVVSQKHVDIKVPIVNVGGIFDERADVGRRAFEASLQTAHRDVMLLPTVASLYALDSFSTLNSVCLLDRAVAVFGPQAPAVDGALRDACAIAHVPHLQAAWQPPEPELEPYQDACANITNPCSQENVEANSRCCFVTLNFHPKADEVSHAVANAIMYNGWTSFTILYDDDFGLMRVQKLLSTLASLTSVRASNFPILVRRLVPSENNQAIFKELDVLHESRILLDCHVDRVMDYMTAAGKSNMLNDYQAFILMTLEANSISQQLVDMPGLRANVSWLSMYEVEDRRIQNDPLNENAKHWFSGKFNTMHIKLETLLVADAANHLSTVISELKDDFDNDENQPPKVCLSEDEQPWALGPTLQKALTKYKSFGFSGNVEFNAQGQRINYKLYLHKMLNGENPVSTYAWESPTRSFNTSSKSLKEPDTSNRSKIFKVIAKLVTPYFLKKTPGKDEELKGNDRFEGYSVDLITEIFEILRVQNINTSTEYSFEFIEPTKEENTQGSMDPKTKQWNGLIGALLTKKADLAICDMTITEERKKVVDFSVPFMTLGISILFTREKPPDPEVFSFLNPYSVEVWIYTATAYLVVSIVLFVSSRISPGDWENPQPCEKEPEELENIWNFKNCTWLTMGSIMTQGCDILPKAIGSRWVCGMWWFFAMIVCQTYIAQLAASLTSALVSEPIKNVEDLANQRKISYGCVAGGSTAQFFARSKDKMYEKMWMNMNSSRPSNLCKDNDEGEQRVKTGKNRFAFFMESTTIEYNTMRNCELVQVGNLLDSKDYGIAMPSNSIFRTKINTAILMLQQSGKLKDIKERWWKPSENNGSEPCNKKKDDMEGDLEIDNLIGAFLVLLVGCVFSVVIAAFEFFDHIRNIVISERISHKEAFMAEIKACLNLTKLQKPVLGMGSLSEEEEKLESERGRHTPRHGTAAASFIDHEKMEQM